jgi:hypothetical protein
MKYLLIICFIGFLTNPSHEVFVNHTKTVLLTHYRENGMENFSNDAILRELAPHVIRKNFLFFSLGYFKVDTEQPVLFSIGLFTQVISLFDVGDTFGLKY